MANKKFLLPDLGEGLPDATIVEWFVKVGDTIKLDDNLVSMETAKAVVEVPSPVSGKVVKLAGAAGKFHHLAGDGRGHFDHGLRGFHRDQVVVQLDRVADLDEPLDDGRVRQAFAEVGQQELLVRHVGVFRRVGFGPPGFVEGLCEQRRARARPTTAKPRAWRQ